MNPPRAAADGTPAEAHDGTVDLIRPIMRAPCDEKWWSSIGRLWDRRAREAGRGVDRCANGKISVASMVALLSKPRAGMTSGGTLARDQSRT